jgi:MFS family permease
MNFKTKYILIFGFFIGAGSWGVVALVSDIFEPFDNSRGFYIGQILLSLSALGIAYKSGIWKLLLFLLSSYVGMNTYAFIFGTSDQRAWFLLGLLTTLSLLVFPLIFGIVGQLANFVVSKFRARNTFAAQPGAPPDASTGGLRR